MNNKTYGQLGFTRYFQSIVIASQKCYPHLQSQIPTAEAAESLHSAGAKALPWSYVAQLEPWLWQETE